MLKHNQDGAVNSLLVSLILAVLLLVAAVAFGGWAFSSRQDYKDNVDAKIGTAVTTAKQQESAAKDAQYAEEAKQPLRTYNGPTDYGSLVVNYPKTWSGYVDDTSSGDSMPIDGYFYPGVVPSINNQASVFALRIQMIGQQYSQVVQSLSGLQQAGKLSISAYALPKVPKVIGIEATGTFGNNQVGTMVVLPVRSYTLEVSTQGTQFLSDFNTYILPNLSFSP